MAIRFFQFQQTTSTINPNKTSIFLKTNHTGWWGGGVGLKGLLHLFCSLISIYFSLLRNKDEILKLYSK